MTVNFILNGEDVVFTGEAGVRLIDILRGNFSLFGAKQGCLSGQCGACAVIFNNLVSPACLIPAFKVQGSEIITIEGFSKSYSAEYQEIISIFAEEHLGNCGYCESGKILCTEALLDRFPSPSTSQILAGFSGIKCRCTNIEKLIKAVNNIAQVRRRRTYGRSS